MFKTSFKLFYYTSSTFEFLMGEFFMGSNEDYYGKDSGVN